MTAHGSFVGGQSVGVVDIAVLGDLVIAANIRLAWVVVFGILLVSEIVSG